MSKIGLGTQTQDYIENASSGNGIINGAADNASSINNSPDKISNEVDLELKEFKLSNIEALDPAKIRSE